MAERFELPAGFRFGVATAGFQVEGGYNGPGEPANNWVGWERCGRVEPSGIALDFWHRYEDHLDRAVAAGCDAFRLSVEWARVEPAEGDIDDTALDRYRAILDACHQRGLLPLITLHHFTHPDWLGEELWLQTDSPERFAAWAAVAPGGPSLRGELSRSSGPVRNRARGPPGLAGPRALPHQNRLSTSAGSGRPAGPRPAPRHRRAPRR